MSFKFNPFTGKFDLDTTKKSQRGSFSAKDIAVPASTTHTVEIDLDRADYMMGQLIVYLPNSVTYSSNKRMTSFIMFTTDINNAIARSAGRTTYNLYGYNFTDNWVKGYHYEDDAYLSTTSYGATGFYLRIESCQIVDNKIELKFRNTHGTFSSVLTCKGEFHVFN